MSNKKRALLIVLILVLLAIVPVARMLMFTVNEREMAVVLQFGRPVRSCIEPGLYFKTPWVQKVRYLPKTNQFWQAPAGKILDDLPTSDGKKIEVAPWAVWRITDPERFVRVLRTTENAELRVATYVRSAVRNEITNNKLAEVVRSTDREMAFTLLESLEPDRSMESPQESPDEIDLVAPGPMPGSQETIRVGREKIVETIKEKVTGTLAETVEEEQGGLGIELVDVGIVRIDFVAKVREEAFKRLIAFYQSIASLYDNEGERLKQEIINKTNAEVERIEGEGKQQANVLRGEVEAEIIDNYAAAIRETGEFYNFIRTLEAYQASLGSNTRLIMTTDSGLLKLLNELTPSEVEAKETP